MKEGKQPVKYVGTDCVLDPTIRIEHKRRTSEIDFMDYAVRHKDQGMEVSATWPTSQNGIYNVRGVLAYVGIIFELIPDPARAS